ncbi:MAG: MFS transporter [Pseudomonadota bacterium]
MPSPTATTADHTPSAVPLSLAGSPAASALGSFSWSLAQGARDPYYILVVIYIFYPYFSNVVVGDAVRGQSLLGYTNAIAGFLLALSAPLLGAIADKSGRRKPWVAGTGVSLALGALALWWVYPDGTGLGIYPTLALIVVINVIFTTSEVFHNAMLPSVAAADRVGIISGTAFALGNVGGLLLMVFVLLAFALPGQLDWSFIPAQPWFGIDQAAHEHDRIVGPLAAGWLILLTLPLLWFTPDGHGERRPLLPMLREGLADVGDTLRSLSHYRNIALYLVARMFFIDGMVGVMTFGGVYASGTFGWDSISLLIFGLCTSAAAMVGAYLGGRLDDRLGSRKTLLLSVAISTLLLLVLVSIDNGHVLFWISVGSERLFDLPYMSRPAEFCYFITNQIFAMFFVTGLASSRTLMARITPATMATQFFGLYALSGTVTAFLAPLLVGSVTAAAISQRAGFASLILLMGLGLCMLIFVRESQASDHRLGPASGASPEVETA